MKGFFKNKNQRALLGVMALFIIFSNFYFLAFVGIKPAQAQALIEAPVLEGITAVTQALETLWNNQSQIWADLKATFFKNVVAVFARDVAKNYAQYIVNGNNGGKPFWSTKLWDSIVEQGSAAWQDSVTGMISKGIGMDVCNFDPTLTLNLALLSPDNPDRTVNSTLFGQIPKGCTFEQLKDHFNLAGEQWQYFLKIQLTTMGPDFYNTSSQLLTDITGKTMSAGGVSLGCLDTRGCLPNPDLTLFKVKDTKDAGLGLGTPAFGGSDPKIIGDLTSFVDDKISTKWKDMINDPSSDVIVNRTDVFSLPDLATQLNKDISIMIKARSHQKADSVPTHLSVGNYYIVEENINEIKNAWNKKINAQITAVNTRKNVYSSCRSKDVGVLAVQDPGNICIKLLTNNLDYGLGYNPGDAYYENLFVNGNQQTRTAWVQSNLDVVHSLARETQNKFNVAYNFYNSIGNGYQSLIQFLNTQLQPAMFRGASAYNFTAAKEGMGPQANNAQQISDQFTANALKAKDTAANKQSTELTINQGWNNVTQKISKIIQTPADLIKAKSIESFGSNPSLIQYSQSIIADSLGVFLNELYNLYLQQMLQKLYNPEKQKSKKQGVSIFNPAEQSVITSTGVALYFESFKPSFNNQFPDVNLLQEFQTFINNKQINPNIYNNVIDQNFALAIQNRMTISDALAQGKISGSAKFSWGSTADDNTLNLSNIRKLRKARVVPLGLEMAADLQADCNFRKTYDPCPTLVFDDCNDSKYSSFCTWNNTGHICTKNPGVDFSTFPTYTFTPDNYAKPRLDDCTFGTDLQKNQAFYSQVASATIKDVVAGFDQRGQDGKCGTYDPGESPFCNLVDPGWVLKIPATKCLAPSAGSGQFTQEYGEILSDNQSGNRYDRCADFVSCVKDDLPNNNCTSANYQICLKEKNVWRLGGQTCDAWNDSCRGYTQKVDGQTVDLSYLKNTLNSSGCDSSTIGCKGYTRYPDFTATCAGKIQTACTAAGSLCQWNGTSCVACAGKTQTACTAAGSLCQWNGTSCVAPKIYFNQNRQTCTSQDEGCHEFISDSTAISNYQNLPNAYDPTVLASRVYYKTNLGCEADPTGQNCANFMNKCADSEVGCATYTPLSGDPSVNAVISADDQCPAECNGFAAFFRQPTNFDPSIEVAYFVPNTARACDAASVGCTQFTNLEKVTSNQAEAIQYYTNLRQCTKIASGLGAQSYFTWQTLAGGAPQVVKHVLQPDTPPSPENPDGSGPPRVYNSVPGVSDDCQGDANVGAYCLKFYDVNGGTSWRDIRKTIIVSDQYCFPFRKTDSNQASCGATNGTWDSTNKYCIYNGYVPTGSDLAKAGFGEASQTCSAANNGCYNYLGGSGHNIYSVFYDDFEGLTSPPSPPSDYSGTDLGISDVSLVLNEQSLSIPANTTATKSISLSGQYYVLSFLAKANTAGKLNVANFGQVNLSTDWFYYTLGPISLSTDLSNLSFDNQTGATIVIDNINLVKQSGFYLIKDTWSTPNCTFDDLNCEAYKGPANQIYYLKGFSNLCSADKVGCQYLLDTKNSKNPQAQTDLGVTTPKDSREAYVVNDKFKCSAPNKGCEKLSVPSYSATTGLIHDIVYVLNDPDSYTGVGGILCTAEAEGCTELKNDQGVSEYYKIDPAKYCQYTSNYVGKSNVTGFFQNNISPTGCNTLPYNNEDDCKAPAHNGVWIAAQSQCAYPIAAADADACKTASGVWLDNQNKCVSDPFGIAKANDTAKYQGYTGVCDAVAQGCTGFQTVNQDGTQGQTYFNIDNDAIDHASCTAPDWNNGCVSFHNTATANNEVQTIKVTKDRDCAVWTECQQTDPSGNCIQMNDAYIDQSGNKVTEKVATSDAVTTPDSQKDNVRFKNDLAGTPRIITRQNYAQRFSVNDAPDDATKRWDMGDYSGYTIPGRFPLEVEINKDYLFTQYPREVKLNNDTRFTQPVCKIFPEQNSPLPHDLADKSQYNKLTNLYSQSVSLAAIGDGCNYDKAVASSITTYFPFGYLSKVVPTNSKPQICTSNKDLEGKLCSGSVANNAQCKSIINTSNTNTNNATENSIQGSCSGVESLKTNLGADARCLEMDLLNPLYGGIYRQGAYACLSYFPFKYDECGHRYNQSDCTQLPYCSWMGGTCVQSVCQYHKNQGDCDRDVINGVKQCLWDGANNACLYRRCSLTPNITTASQCANLNLKYCAWIGNRCTEDICQGSYSGLVGGLSSHPASIYDICTTNKSPYCVWSASLNGGQGRPRYQCNLKCDRKYPGSSFKDNCNADGYCTWRNASCVYKCDAYTSADTCTGDCIWDSSKSKCLSSCNQYSTVNTSGDPTANTDCQNHGDKCAQTGSYACADVCSAATTDYNCYNIANGGCGWNNQTNQCVSICDIQIEEADCNSITYKTFNMCKWEDSDPDPTKHKCIKNATDANSVANSNCGVADLTTCQANFGCGVKGPECVPLNECHKIGAGLPTEEAKKTACQADTTGNCSWSEGSCQNRIDTYACYQWTAYDVCVANDCAWENMTCVQREDSAGCEQFTADNCCANKTHCSLYYYSYKANYVPPFCSWIGTPQGDLGKYINQGCGN